jgi:hypothetical protein
MGYQLLYDGNTSYALYYMSTPVAINGQLKVNIPLAWTSLFLFIYQVIDYRF